MNNAAQISIGITAYKCSDYLINAIDSVINQSVTSWEAILVMDGGADSKTKYIYNNFKHPKFRKFAFEENVGPYDTRKKAIELAETEWYYQLDGDDLLPYNAVQLVLNAIDIEPDAKFVYGNSEYFSDTNSMIIMPNDDPETLCIKPLFISTSPIRKSLFQDLGGYSNELFIGADWDFWLNVYENNIIGTYTDNLIYKRRQRKNNVGNTHIHLLPNIIDKIIKRHPKYFASNRRIKYAKFHVYQKLARFYKSIGDRKKAAKYARESIKYGDAIPVFETIFQEEKMSIFRYAFRRLGRLL